MFLPLPALSALLRALGAMVVVLASSVGHAGMAHHHVGVVQPALAFLLLLYGVWSSNDVRRLLLLGALAQCIVHGGVPTQSLGMLVLHAVAAFVTGLIAWRTERVWDACGLLLRPLRAAVRILAAPLVTLRRVRLPLFALSRRLRSAAALAAVPRRGPPLLA